MSEVDHLRVPINPDLGKWTGAGHPRFSVGHAEDSGKEGKTGATTPLRMALLRIALIPI